MYDGQKNTIQKILSAVVLLLMLYAYLVYPLSFLYKEFQYKQQAKRNILLSLPEEQLIPIADHPNIDWEEEGRELYMNDHLYDVVKTKMINGKKLFLVVDDLLENDLIQKNARFFNDQQSGQKQKRNTTSFQQYKQWVYVLITISDPSFHQIRHHSFYLKNDVFHLFNEQDVLIPPPKAV